MFRQIVFLALVALASSAPGFLHGGYHHLPAATSYSSRVDVHHSKPIIHSYAAPIIKTVVAEPIIAAPIHYSAPLVSSHGLGHGLSLGHGSYGLGLSSGYGHGLSGGYGHGLGLSSGYGLGHGIGYGHGW